MCVVEKSTLISKRGKGAKLKLYTNALSTLYTNALSTTPVNTEHYRDQNDLKLSASS